MNIDVHRAYRAGLREAGQGIAYNRKRYANMVLQWAYQAGHAHHEQYSLAMIDLAAHYAAYEEGKRAAEQGAPLDSRYGKNMQTQFAYQSGWFEVEQGRRSHAKGEA